MLISEAECASKQIANCTTQLLQETVRMQRVEERDCLNQLTVIVAAIDETDFRSQKRRFWQRKSVPAAEVSLKYQQLAYRLEQVAIRMGAWKQQLAHGLLALERIFQSNDQAQIKLNQVLTEALTEIVTEHVSEYVTQMRASLLIAKQTAAQIRLLQQNYQQVIQMLDQTFMQIIPVFKQQLRELVVWQKATYAQQSFQALQKRTVKRLDELNQRPVDPSEMHAVREQLAGAISEITTVLAMNEGLETTIEKGIYDDKKLGNKPEKLFG